MHSWGKFWTKDTKRPNNNNNNNQTNPTATSEELSKHNVGSKSRALHMPPSVTPPNRLAKLLCHPSGPTSRHILPSSHIRNQLSPFLRGEQGNMLLVFAPSCSFKSPSKTLPEFLVWPLIHLYWRGKAKNPGQYQDGLHSSRSSHQWTRQQLISAK